ncbi:MAG: diguanylate cyclase [Gaiellaceae bacterium]
MLGSFRLKLAAYFLLLGVLPLAAAFLGFRAVMEGAQTQRVDARLGAELRAAVAGYDGELGRRLAKAQNVAQAPGFQGLARRGDRAGLLRLVARNPWMGIELPNGSTLGAPPTLAAESRVRLRSGGKVLATIVATLPFDRSLLARLGRRAALADGDRLVAVSDHRRLLGAVRGDIRLGRRTTAAVSVAGTSYRILATRPLPEQPRTQLAVLTPVASIQGASAAAQRRLLLALLAGLAVIALVALIEGHSIIGTLAEVAAAAEAIRSGRLERRVRVRGRDEFARLARAFNAMAGQLQARLEELALQRQRLRESISRLGTALSATNDRLQLLELVAQSAIEATGASGVVVLTDTGEVVEAGDISHGTGQLELPLAFGSTRFGTVVLFGEHVDGEGAEAARSLIAHASVALENARLHGVLESQALADELTGLPNRRRCEEVLRAEVSRAERYGLPLSVVLCDLDDFKTTNDTHGHAAGDLLLQEFAAVLRETLRDIDLPARWGGEEFLLVLPGVDLMGATNAAERIREEFCARRVGTLTNGEIGTTASFGAAELVDGLTAADLVDAADQALYAAKREGKNRVESAARVSG